MVLPVTLGPGDNLGPTDFNGLHYDSNRAPILPTQLTVNSSANTNNVSISQPTVLLNTNYSQLHATNLNCTNNSDGEGPLLTGDFTAPNS